MAPIFEFWFMELGAVLMTLFAGFYIYMTLRFQYWKKRGVPYLEPSFPFGNGTDLALQRKTFGDTFAAMYRKLDGNKFGGIFQMHRPALLALDPDFVKTVLVKDFASFHDRGLSFDVETDPLTCSLLHLEGTKWKHLRYKLTPIFSSGKIKMMFPTFVECGNELKDHLAPMATSKETIEITDVLARYSTDIIATCAFGIQSNCLKNPDSEFRKMGKKSAMTTFNGSIRDLVFILAPKILEIIKVPSIPADVTKFFLGIVKETIDYREKFKVTRNDFMQQLINIKNNKNVNDPVEISEQREENFDEQKLSEKNMYDVNGMTTAQITAQAFAFFIAGFETSSTTMSFCLYELALNQDIQDRLRDEVDSVITDHGGEMTYEAIMKMEYLDMVVAETLRKYPPAPTLLRSCTKDYQLPGTKAVVERGTYVIIPIYGLHHDPQYYPNPEDFDPDRFTEEAKSQRHQFVYIPFGEGPHMCMGVRFGLMQTKVGLASVISSYQVNVCKRETAIPLVMDIKSFIMAAKGGIKLQITERVKL